MNMQAMLKQAQAMQRDMMKAKEEIVDVVINADDVEKDDLDMISDLFVVATNNAMKKVDDYTEKKMAKFGNIPGLF